MTVQQSCEGKITNIQELVSSDTSALMYTYHCILSKITNSGFPFHSIWENADNCISWGHQVHFLSGIKTDQHLPARYETDVSRKKKVAPAEGTDTNH